MALWHNQTFQAIAAIGVLALVCEVAVVLRTRSATAEQLTWTRQSAHIDDRLTELCSVLFEYKRHLRDLLVEYAAQLGRLEQKVQTVEDYVQKSAQNSSRAFDEQMAYLRETCATDRQETTAVLTRLYSRLFVEEMVEP